MQTERRLSEEKAEAEAEVKAVSEQAAAYEARLNDRASTIEELRQREVEAMKASAQLQSRIDELEANAAESLIAQVSATATAADANDRVQMLDHGLAATQADEL